MKKSIRQLFSMAYAATTFVSFASIAQAPATNQSPLWSCEMATHDPLDSKDYKFRIFSRIDGKYRVSAEILEYRAGDMRAVVFREETLAYSVDCVFSSQHHQLVRCSLSDDSRARYQLFPFVSCDGCVSERSNQFVFSTEMHSVSSISASGSITTEQRLYGSLSIDLPAENGLQTYFMPGRQFAVRPDAHCGPVVPTTATVTPAAAAPASATP
jgi:hypothetical protein